MNAPTSMKPPSRRREDYIPAIRSLMPGAGEKEEALRCSIMLIRDNASSALRRCGSEAQAILLAVEQLATAYVFQAMPLSALEALRYQLIRLVASASGLETFAHLLAEGDDARG